MQTTLKYLKLWEDWEAPEEWAEPSADNIVSSGIQTELIDQVRGRHRLDPEGWSEPSGTQETFSFSVSNNIIQVPGLWQNIDTGFTYKLVDRDYISCTIYKFENYPTTISITIAYSGTGNATGSVRFDLHWQGDPINNISDITRALFKLTQRFVTLSPEEALKSDGADSEWKICEW